MKLHPLKVRDSEDFKSVMNVFLNKISKDEWCFEHIFSFFYACGASDGFYMSDTEFEELCKEDCLQ